jgi:hypothetical protein
MGLFGPTKKSGGLDKRYKSNKGGYLGKAVRFGSAVSDLSKSSSSHGSYEQMEQDERNATATSTYYGIAMSEIPSSKDELIKYLTDLTPFISDDGIQKIALGVSQELKDNIKQAAQEKYMMAGYILKELSPTDAVFFENKITKVKSDEKKRIKLIVIIMIVALGFCGLVATGVIELN